MCHDDDLAHIFLFFSCLLYTTRPCIINNMPLSYAQLPPSLRSLGSWAIICSPYTHCFVLCWAGVAPQFIAVLHTPHRALGCVALPRVRRDTRRRICVVFPTARAYYHCRALPYIRYMWLAASHVREWEVDLDHAFIIYIHLTWTPSCVVAAMGKYGYRCL